MCQAHGAGIGNVGHGIVLLFLPVCKINTAHGFEGLEPYLIVTVELNEGVRLMSLLYNCSVDQVQIGMPVRMCWDKINEDFDYFGFEPES